MDPYKLNTFKKLSHFFVMMLILGVMFTVGLLSLTHAATLTVDNSGLCNDGTGVPFYCTIGAAVTASSFGDTISIATGTYTENIIITKTLTLNGAGSGAAETVIKSAAANTPVININGDTASGSSVSNRLSIKNLRVTGATGGSGSGIRVTGSISSAHMTFENITAISNGGSGITLEHTGAVTDVKVISSTLSSNSGSGFLIPSTIGSFSGLTMTAGQIVSNSTSGLNVNPTGSNIPIDDINVDGTTFANNATPINNQADISLFEFEGNAALSNINITASGTYGIQIRGKNGTVTPTISISNVTISGTPSKVGLLIQKFTDVSNFSMNNVDLVGVNAGWYPLAVQHSGSTPLDLGTTTFPASGPGLSMSIWGTGGLDATSAIFSGAADNFAIEDRILHKIDLSSQGLVTWVPNNVFVTTSSFASPATTFPDISRGVDAASAGWQVNVATGTFTSTTVISKNVIVQGRGINQTILQGDGTSCHAAGISFSGSRSNTTIADLTVKGFQDGIQMFTGPLANILIEDVEALNNCRHGIWSQASGINGLTIRRVNASDNSNAGGRGIWVINGVKQNVTIENSTFNNNGLVGIDISDGNVTNLIISGTTVFSNGDSGIGVLGPQGPGSTVVNGNILANNGRYGIEIKNPSGNGSTGGAGSVVVSNNVVSRTVDATDARDYAGIAVFRRSPSGFNADQPAGVVITANQVSGYRKKPSGATGDGFGIVIEGANHTVAGNTTVDNDIGIQLQAGNPTINAQNTDYFDRGDASNTNSALVSSNNVMSNTDGIRSIGPVTATISMNLVYTNTQHGVRILNEASTGVLVNNNRICANANGVQNLGASSVDATNNWWNAADGPGPVGPGSGDTISNGVIFSPFTSSNSVGPCAIASGGWIYLPVIYRN